MNKVCLEWSLDAGLAEELLKQIMVQAKKHHASSTLATISSVGVDIPPIHNVHRWWRADVLHEMLCIKAAIHSLDDLHYRDFFRLVLAGVLVPDLTNVTLGRLQLHFIDRSKHSIDTAKIFESHAKLMIGDLHALNKERMSASTILIHGDSTSHDTYKKLPVIDAVITSPPYPNRYSYVWNTRPHLYMLDFIKVAKVAADIDKKTIGGTWGSATSDLLKGDVSPLNDVVAHALMGLDLRIRAKDNLMANYVVHYFNRLALHLAALRKSVVTICKVSLCSRQLMDKRGIYFNGFDS